MSSTGTQSISRFWSKIGLVADIARILREKPTNKKTLSAILELISQIIPFNSATLYLLNKNKDQLDEVVSLGETVNKVEFLQFGIGSGLAGWAAKQKRAVLIPGRNPESHGVRQHHNSVLILPLLVVGELVGVLCFSHPDPEAFDENQQKLLEIVANQIAISLERILHQRELENRNRSLVEAQQTLRDMQSKLIAQEKLKAVVDLAASVNHEVNNPLSIIVGNAQIIDLESSDLPQRFNQRIKAIVDAAKRISLITHKLLKINKLVSENYLNNQGGTMLNLNKSAGDSV
jgi:GAF domain-containing protein